MCVWGGGLCSTCSGRRGCGHTRRGLGSKLKQPITSAACPQLTKVYQHSCHNVAEAIEKHARNKEKVESTRESRKKKAEDKEKEVWGWGERHCAPLFSSSSLSANTAFALLVSPPSLPCIPPSPLSLPPLYPFLPSIPPSPLSLPPLYPSLPSIPPSPLSLPPLYLSPLSLPPLFPLPSPLIASKAVQSLMPPAAQEQK